MKKLTLYLSLIVLTFTILNCTTENFDVQDEQLLESEKKVDKTTGYDEWGFNFRAHHFKGYLINAIIADPAFAWATWYREPGLVYQGEGQEFWEYVTTTYPGVQVNPDLYIPGIADMMPGGLVDCKLEMKWNEAALSSTGVYPPTWDNTGAWFLFKYKMKTENEKWTQIRKFISISTGDELIEGIWYNSKGEEIGMKSYYWPDQLIIRQVVNTGDNPWVPAVMPPDYTCPNSNGFGGF